MFESLKTVGRHLNDTDTRPRLSNGRLAAAAAAAAAAAVTEEEVLRDRSFDCACMLDSA